MTRGEPSGIVIRMKLPDAIRRALFPQSDLPDFPPGHPTRSIRVEGVPVTLPVVLPIGLVSPEHVEESRIEHLVDAVRRALRMEERARAIWIVPKASVPDGLGAYRALVRARWEAAAARGTPVLTVGAGAMSRPILERLGFSIVGWADNLLDEFG